MTTKILKIRNINTREVKFMRGNFNLRTIRHCGELKMQGYSYRSIQREIGNIGYNTVKTYCKIYLNMINEAMQQCWNILKQASIRAEAQQLLVVKN